MNLEIFEAIADSYDTEERIEIAKITVDNIKAYLQDICKEKTALDFACGTGLIGLDLCEYFKFMILADTSKNMINVVTEKIQNKNINNAKAICFDIENDFFNVKVDYIFVSLALLHIEDVKSVLNYLYEFLNTDGKIIIIDFIKNENVKSDLVHNGFFTRDIVSYFDYPIKVIDDKIFHKGENIFMGVYAEMFILVLEK